MRDVNELTERNGKGWMQGPIRERERERKREALLLFSLRGENDPPSGGSLHDFGEKL